MAKQKMKINYTYREFVRVIESHGWQIQRSAKHSVYVHPERSGQKLVLPHGNGDVPPGVVRQIMNTIQGTYYGQNARFA